MPIQKCNENGQQGWQWGSGKCFIGPNAKEQAIKQAIAIGKGKMPKDEKDEFEYYEDDLIIEDAEKRVMGFIPPPYPENMPKEAVTILTHTYANIREQWVKEHPNDPENKNNKKKAASIAWAAVEKAGFKKNKEGNYVKSKDENDFFHLDAFDNSKLFLTDKMLETPEGFLKGKSIVTNTGIFKYITNEGKILKELRENDEVFKSESLNTLKNIPITDGHPEELVTADNIEELQKKGVIIGFTGSNLSYDGHAISIDMTITNKKAIDNIKNGIKRALSCGYKANLDYSKSGMAFGNNEYDCIQRDINYNHIALVTQGRAGDLAKIPINMDSLENISIQIIDDNFKQEDKMDPKKISIQIDGDYFDVEKPVSKHIDSLQNNLNEKNQILSDLNQNIKKMEGEKAAHEDEIKKLKKEKEDAVLTSDQIQILVDQRLELTSIADHLELKYEKNVNDKDLKLEIIKKRNNADLLDKSDEFIDAYFNAVKDSLKSEIENKNANKNKQSVFSNYLNKDFNNEKKDNVSKQQQYDEYKKRVIAESQNYKGAVSVE